MTEHGMTCRHRAILETERRFFKKNTEDKIENQGLDHVDIRNHLEMSDREYVILLLDPRKWVDKNIFEAGEW